MNIIDKFKQMRNGSKPWEKLKYPWQKYYKKNERDIEVPDESLYDYLVDENVYNLKLPAINYFNNKITFKDFFKQIDDCAKAFKSQGVRCGDVVTICMPNTPEAIVAFYAINKIGAIANMVHPLSAEAEIKFSLESTNSVMLICIDLAYDNIKNIVDDTDVYKVVIVKASDSMPSLLGIGYYLTRGLKTNKPNKSEKYMYWSDFVSRGKKYEKEVHVKRGRDDDALILHSGGTTGVPKNIVLTNGNVNAIMEQAKIIFPDLGPKDSFLAVLPIFHCFGLVVCIHAPLCLGAQAILIPQFDAKRFDKLITKYKPTVLAGVPTLFQALLNNKYMVKVSLANVKYVISGGDSLTVAKNEEVNKFLKEHNCKTGVMQGYGMTETTGPAAFGSLGSDKLGSVGIPLPGNIIKIVEPTTGIEMNTGEVGEICIAGPTVMKGYLDNEEETSKTIRLHDDGIRYVHTGDLGYMDKDGVIFFVQRLKRMLIVSGYNVYPSHIENVLLNHPYVKVCGVIGVKHKYKVQVPKAYIVLADGVEDSLKVRAEIREYCNKNLAHYMVPKEIEIRKSLPTTMIGKVNYKELEKE